METPTLILAGIGLAVAIGGVAVFVKKGGDKEASALDQNTIRAYRDSEVVMQRTIDSLQTQLQTKDDIIDRLLHNGKHSSKKSSK